MMKKNFPVFDCDAHIRESSVIWSEYVEPEYRELVKQSYWGEDTHTTLNGKVDSRVRGMGGGPAVGPKTSGHMIVDIAGPQMNKKIMRWLKHNSAALTEEQHSYFSHMGAWYPEARLADM